MSMPGKRRQNVSSIRSVNEPAGSRVVALTPQSINEPLTLDGMPELPAPVIASINPSEATIGDASFTLYVTGEHFRSGTTIVFAGKDEPTTLNEDGTVSTLVDMNYWHGPDVLKVSVYNGALASNEVDFTFHPEVIEGRQQPQQPPPEQPTRAAEVDQPDYADPDELEDELEQAREEGDYEPTHKSASVTVKKTVKVKK